MATAASIMAAIASGGYHRLSDRHTLVALTGFFSQTAGLTLAQCMDGAQASGYGKLADGDLDVIFLAVFSNATDDTLSAAGVAFEAIPEGDTWRAVLTGQGGGGAAATLLAAGAEFDALSDRDLKEALIYAACSGGSCDVATLLAKASAKGYDSMSQGGVEKAIISATNP